MDAGLLDKNQEVKVKESEPENDNSYFENVDYSHCFETTEALIKKEIGDNTDSLGNRFCDSHIIHNQNLHANMETGPQIVNQVARFGEEMFDNDTQNTGYTHCFENRDSNCQTNEFLNQSMDKVLRNIKQETQVDCQRLQKQNNDNIFIFENSDSANDRLVETMNIQQEFRIYSELENKYHGENVNSNLNFENTKLIIERTDLTFETGNSCLEAESSNDVSNSINHGNVENNSVRIYLNPGIGSNSIEKHDLTLENSGLLNDRCKDTITESYLNSKDRSYFKTITLQTEKNDLPVSIAQTHLKPHNAEWNFQKFDCGNSLMNKATDSPTDHTMDSGFASSQADIDRDFQPIASKRPHIVFNKGHELCQMTQPDLCPPGKNSSSNENLQGHSIELNKDISKQHSSVGDHTVESSCSLGSPLIHPRTGRNEHDERPHVESSCSLGSPLIGPRTARNERPHKCNVCKRGFKTVHGLGKHMIGHRNDATERPHQCNVCEKACKTFSALKGHMISHQTEQTHQCHACGRMFKTTSVLRQHMLTHSTEQPHRCDVCGRGFKTITRLKQHMYTHTTERPHQCTLCEKRFKNKTVLRNHKRVHSTDRPHPCNLCGKGFKTKEKLRRHLVSHSTERPFKCTVCETAFKTLHDLRKHMHMHITDGPYKCTVCGQGFINMIQLNQHISVDTHSYLNKGMTSDSTERLYRCNVCDKTFKTTLTLRTHMISHSTERPHRCNLCEKGFKTAVILKTHMVTHGTERPFKCGQCEKGFKSQVHLNHHMNVHNTELIHQCHLCGKAFKSKVNLPRHIRRHSTNPQKLKEKK